jgi:hypothetical protein
MNNVTLQLYHPTLNLLSDRTFRELLKKLSALTREIQAQEVLHLVRTSDLPSNLQQSLRDKLKPKLSHLTAYYVEDVKRGSLELVVSVTLVGIWLLQTTLGETIKEAWLQTQFHKKLLEYLTSSGSSGRRKTIEKNIDLVVNNWKLDKFLIQDVSTKVDKSNDLTVRVKLESLPVSDEKAEELSKPVDVDFVVENGRQMLRKLSDDEA